MVLSLLTSVIIIVAGHLFPAVSILIRDMILGIDFHKLLMKAMLAFLLFAGAIHIDAQGLKKALLPIITLATVGTLISTFIVGFSLSYLFTAFHIPIPGIYCYLFAALISPTDPIAVLAILKKAGIQKSLELKISGESLFNDGIAVVLFIGLIEIAQIGIDKVSVTDIVLLFAREAIGGLVYGAILGYFGFFIIKSVNNYQVEVLISIALVMGGYLIADRLHISGPLAMVMAGIIAGNKRRADDNIDTSSDYLGKFWDLMDELLNAVLFLLIGFEMLVVKIDTPLMVISLIAIAIVLVARWVSVAIPITLLRYKVTFEKNAIAILTWGGLRGGLSVALALSLPQEMYRDQFVSITYIIVIFSILIQGLTIGKVAKKLGN